MAAGGKAGSEAGGVLNKLRQQQTGLWKHLVQKIEQCWPQQVESADYRAWRHQFLSERLRLCFWIAVPCFMTFVLRDSYELFLYPEQFNQKIVEDFGSSNLVNQLRYLTIVGNAVVGLLLIACLLLRRTLWGQRHPGLLFLGFSWSMTVVPQIIGTYFQIPDSGGGGWFLVFLVQATLMPVRWRLHLLSQLGTMAYFIGINSLLGLTAIEGQSIYSSGIFILLFWFCFICDLAVYLYERLQRNEFQSRRELRLFLHTVSHDLKTPVMGTAIVLQNLLKKTEDEQISVNRQVLERLLQGSERQLDLIHSLLEAHTAEVQELVLHRQPTDLRQLVSTVLADLEPALLKNQIQLHHQIAADLPKIDVDPTQLWRVYSNLITNAVKHNPHGIEITLRAELLDKRWLPRLPRLARSRQWLCCYVSDSGVGIPPAQHSRLFELYARGSSARYMPGLGLGLYLCRQIITAHQGEIGIADCETGATFWFLLPLAEGSAPAAAPAAE
ncbi:MAG: HAMP domain-containing histidine kinase [Pegethrix bostrychoides GSE-TBD4-15B]|jgi:signal transduction histidine kinase|uniref:histidine kinase n=1 Tax=Pegethrix bostrychoides GSE-TBD4-15B TaxID=2839662 RepID=A0A951U6Y0_9CYAN|nr:HAMP domain-containing histidine kinase [Pegethrix bostrychoides GSE-TBD4-15B]